MKKSLNIAIIGMGNWGNHLLEEVLKLDEFNVKYVCCRDKCDVTVKTGAPVICDDDVLLNDNEIEGAIIATQPEKHFQTAANLLKKGIKVFIEKPLTLSYKDCTELMKISSENNLSGIMVGNKFAYSEAINNLKEFIMANNIKIKSISSRWLKGGGVQKAGIFFDIAYHHIYLCDYLIGRQFDNLQAFTLNKQENIAVSGLVILNYGDIVCSVEASYNNHFDFYEHSFRIETDQGVFMIREKDRKISVYFDNKKLSSLLFEYKEENETCVERELLAYYRWASGKEKLSFGPEHDLRIIQFLDRAN